MVNGKIAYTITSNIKFSLIGKYVDKMKPYFNTTPIFDANDLPSGKYIGFTADDVPAYFTLDANLHLEAPFKSNLYLNINVTNILDQDIFYPTFQETAYGQIKAPGALAENFISPLVINSKILL
ncbi:MAG: hypothetical protein HC831_14205 [Chloroflexia bacterium]|nr:hypothetical protein [Chloroflexia bacterium]